jgi:hypothetical protein
MPERKIEVFMYRRPLSLVVLDGIRAEMARDADYDADLFAQNIRSGYTRRKSKNGPSDRRRCRSKMAPGSTDAEPRLMADTTR